MSESDISDIMDNEITQTGEEPDDVGEQGAEDGENTEDNSNKRKGSPFSKEEVKKSLSDSNRKSLRCLRRQNSLPNIAKLINPEKSKEKGRPGSMAFSDMVSLTFNDF